jgi:hypothetical protein
MYITAFPHRDKLFDITDRWLSNRLDPDDPLRITRIINYDSYTAWETMLQFTTDLNRQLCREKIHRKSITIKQELKDFICDAEGTKSDRVRRLISEYKNLPEYHYVGSPVAGYLFHDTEKRIISICRLKRAKRIAEKTSRYAALHVTRMIREAADKLWLEFSGEPTIPETMPEDVLAEAEKQLMMSIKKNGFTLPVDIMEIRDVMGIKVIQNGISENRLESVIDQFPNVKIIEKETHSGRYNAVHYILELKVDIKQILQKFSLLKNHTQFSNRGLPATDIVEDFTAFTKTGADSVQLDLIFITYEELIESEIGRSTHEARIFKQRRHQSSFGNIPINIEYLMEYLIAVGLSPAVHIDEIPIKIWGRYLPDTLGYRIRNLYKMPGDSIVHV